ncbi:MAG: S8 family serine peptidase, partial [Saprospiraceae bacterium]|nr:S8 family serine peptidase [Saprospiraceae bacterium]
RILTQLKHYFVEINKLATKLSSHTDSRQQQLGELLNMVFEVPRLEHIFVENGYVVLAVWGFYPMRQEERTFQLKKVMAELPIIDPPNPEGILPGDELKDKEEIKAEPEAQVEPPQADPPQKEPQPVVDTDKAQTTEKVTPQQEPKTEQVPPPATEEKKKRTWKDWLWLLWLLLGTAAIIYLIYILLNANPVASDSNTNNPILPPNPGEIPAIDTSQIVEDTDDPLKRKILANRLNLYLAKDANLQEFAKQFKAKYTDAQYKVVYYNPQIKKLQIECPPDKKVELKNSLKKDFAQVKLVLDEAILRNEQAPSINDPAFSNPDQHWSYDRIRTREAWGITQGDPSVVVAVIDDGFDPTHPEFQNNKLASTWNMVTNSSNVNTGRVGMSHGTHVASSVAGILGNRSGMSGVAPKCKLMLIQVADSRGNMSGTAIMEAVLYAVYHGANVINMSLGSGIPPELKSLSEQAQRELAANLHTDQAKAWDEIFMIAEQNNVTIVQAAGNDNVLAILDPMKRSKRTVVVSATSKRDLKAPFSNYGQETTLSAPGMKIYSALPNGKYGFMDGTSMASPIVAGAYGLLLSKKKGLKSEEYTQILQRSGIRVDSAIGPMIQLDIALRMLDNFESEKPCEELVDSLQRELDYLRDLLKDTGQVNQRFVIPDNTEDLGFTKGRWRSSSTIRNAIDQSPVMLYFEFNGDGKGELKLEESSGITCSARLNLELSNDRLEIDQEQFAKCEDGRQYQSYQIVCDSRGKQAAICTATSKLTGDRLVFTLKRE